MKQSINFTISLLILSKMVIAQTPWYLIGNSIASGDFIGTTNSQDFVIKTNTSEVARFQVGGNVGIGTNNPGNLLHMNKTGATDDLYLQWTNGNTNYTQGMIMGVNTSNQGVINMKEQKPLHFYTDSTLRMEITGGGKVGIGTDAAQNLVHQHVTGSNNTYHPGKVYSI